MLQPAEGDTRFAKVPVCDPAVWLRALELVLEQASVQRLMRRRRRGYARTLQIAGMLAASADFGTGRNVAISFQRIGDELGIEATTVRQYVHFLSFLGFHIEVCHGRDRLTLEELEQARELGAAGQTAAASTRYLTIPRFARRLLQFVASLRGSAPLHTLKNFKKQNHGVKSPDARESAASRREATRRGERGGRQRNRRAAQPLSSEQNLFAAQLTGVLPWLRHLHRAAVCRILARSGWPAGQLEVRDLLELHEQRSAALGLTPLTVDQVRNPGAYLAHLLASALTFARTSGYRSRAQRAADAAALQAERDQQRAAERAAREAADALAATPEALAAREAFFAEHARLREQQQTAAAPGGRDVDPAGLAAARAEIDAIRAHKAGM